jgi:hypothetical protein
MRLVYVDEAGIGDDAKEPLTVVAAVIINGDTQWRTIESDIKDLKSDYSQLDRDTELKANQIFWGQGKFQPWKREDRVILQKTLLGLIKRHNLSINIGVVDREYLKSLSHIRHVKAQDFALVMCLHETESWFCKHAPGEVGIVIADETDREEVFKHSLQIYREHPIGPVKAKFNHLIEPILFADSKETWGIQLADHCAFFMKRFLCQKADSTEFFEIIKPMLTDVQVFEEKPQIVNMIP